MHVDVGEGGVRGALGFAGDLLTDCAHEAQRCFLKEIWRNNVSFLTEAAKVGLDCNFRRGNPCRQKLPEGDRP